MILEIDGVKIPDEKAEKHEVILTFKNFEISQIMLHGYKTYNRNKQIIQTDDKFLSPENYLQFIDDMIDNLPMDIMDGGLEDDGSFYFDFFFKNNDFYHLAFKSSQVAAIHKNKSTALQ
jgi:phosphoribosyl 1,2-cyclic phosphodiesterase